ncbi:histone lysine demethylase PHF8 isoform X2 [Nilaparvata lugens]|uniref:histone lysine demethylase PHF8 isoform X2 n=1 Tax=Nilaparvata lugens TaxID=108931 RepID=UPI000B9869B8|nr:histone lysine demethylase PHF8 isoform X2 [Nilaparvata lugens]
MEAKAKQVHCFCGKNYHKKYPFMIQCDACKDWFHGRCVNVLEIAARDYEIYHCPQCVPNHGPTIMKIVFNRHRHDFYDKDGHDKPLETGSPLFIEELKKRRHFKSSEGLMVKMKGKDLTVEYLLENGFDRPILIEKKKGLGITLPPPTLTLRDIEEAVGSDRSVNVIDVYTQSTSSMRFGDFVNYFLSPDRHRILNLVCLEISDSSLTNFVEPPVLARSMDWANTLWPETYDLKDKDYCSEKATVQKYCLISAKDSYSDFHIDFGGTSVWYHIIKGTKTFYLIEPTPANLALFERWMTSSNQFEMFFGDQVDDCYECTIRAGDTVLIPSGWIHAVLTPEDSLVFGGNFLHSLSIPMQLQVYDIERKVKTPEKLRFPGFETMNWFAAKGILKELQELNRNSSQVPAYLLNGTKALLSALKQWQTDKKVNRNKREHIPLLVEAPVLLKELSKEIRTAERFLTALNPPKPERESKRKRRKPLNKDFVDYSHPLSVKQEEEVKSDVKDPLKLSIKVLNKKVNQEENNFPPVQPLIRPPLKLTLPKTSTYPYTYSTPLEQLPIKTEADNFVVGEQQEMKMKIEKLKLPLRSWDSGMNEKSCNANRSVYDFHDDSDDTKEEEDCLHIDESKGRRKTPSFRSNKYQHSSQLMTSYRDSSEVDVTDSPKNGIEELLKASCYANPNLQTQTGRRSPSTTEAIAGMLSIAGQGPSFPASDRSTLRRKARDKAIIDEEIYETIRQVHQDDDFIYPSLDSSDDEDELPTSSKGKVGDKAWNPRAKMGTITPKLDRPAREGVKRQAVEKGLEAAAAKRANTTTATASSASTAKSTISRKRSASSRNRNRSRKKAATAAAVFAVGASTSTASTSTDSAVASTAATAGPSGLQSSLSRGKKAKKGMATAKQRLGKILKLHKIIH